jgi:hypothetical protein
MRFKLLTSHKSKNLPATSLVEVLVVLAIVASTMVAATQLSVRALIDIKQNEIEDYANSVMLKALEVAKSPSDINVTHLVTAGNYTGSYSSSLLNGKPVLYQQSPTIVGMGTCTSGSVYYTPLTGVTGVTPPLACLQVQIQPKTGLNSTYYEITSTISFQLSDQMVTKTIVGYRRNKFNEQ